MPALSKALEDSEGKVREYAADALGKIGPKAAAAVPALSKALKDGDKLVREAAEKALVVASTGVCCCKKGKCSDRATEGGSANYDAETDMCCKSAALHWREGSCKRVREVREFAGGKRSGSVGSFPRYKSNACQRPFPGTNRYTAEANVAKCEVRLPREER